MPPELVKPGQPFRWVTDEDYVCTLNKASEEKARKELNEDPKDRLDAVKALREWIEQQPHLTFEADTVQLLAFLRTSKFSQLRARTMVNGFVKAVTTYKSWFADLDSHDPRVLEILNTGAILPLPKKDKEGRGLMMMRPARFQELFKSQGYSHLDEVRTHAVIGSYRERDENVLVNGQIFIMDFTGVTLTDMLRSNNEEMRRWHKAIQGNFPGRHKGFYFYNAGPVLEVVMGIVKSFMPKKFHERMYVFDTAESLYKAVDMELLPAEYLPDDYKGPHAGTCEEIIANAKKELLREDYRAWLRARMADDVSLDESKRPSDIPQASFRKLTVD